MVRPRALRTPLIDLLREDPGSVDPAEVLLHSPVTARVVRVITVNLLRAFAGGPAGVHHPSRSNLARLGIAP